MTKTLMTWLIRLGLATLVLMVAVAVWFGIQSSRNVEVAQPYFEQRLPAVLTGDPADLAPILTAPLRDRLESPQGQPLRDLLTRLGPLESFSQLQYVGGHADIPIETQHFDLLRFSLLGQFRHGRAQLGITLAQPADRDSAPFQIHQFDVQSDLAPGGDR